MKCKKITLVIGMALVLFSRNAIAQTTDTFQYVSDTTQTWTVPGCVTQVTLQLWGGGGGSGHQVGYHDAWCGGSGAYMEGVLSGLTAGDILELYVPDGGQYYTFNIYAPGGWPGGGKAGSDNNYLEYGGGGGGYAAVKIDTTYYVVAGGGGGGGSTEYGGIAYGGGGGGTTGGNGVTSIGTAGQGGTLSAGGAMGFPNSACDPGSAGTFLTGGMGGGRPCSGYYGGGGGGGGYYGGGGGGDWGNSGGGGSSFPGSTFVLNGITFTPGVNTQGNTNSFNSGRALAPSSPFSDIGDAPIDSAGGNGLIIITYSGSAIPLTSVISGQVNPTCGICDGSAWVTASGGGGPYTYYWYPGGQTGDTATGLCAGSYTVIVIDSCGDATAASTLLVAIPLTVSTSVTAQDKCNGDCTGKATVTVSLGASPYTYSWQPGGESNAIATGLCAGVYTIMVTDINGCTGTATATVTEPTAIVLNDMVSNIMCYGGGGSATVNATGGYSFYSYLWNPGGQTTAAASGLGAGTYTVTVKDSGGCTATIAATIMQPGLLTATMSGANNILCYGEAGSATVTGGGGTSPYTYLWTPPGQTTANATGLGAGTYHVTITDSNGCTATAGVSITQPSLLTATMGTPVNVLCYGGNGSATITAGGGTSPYTYLWTPTGQTTAIANGLGAGAYSAMITDGNGCTATAMVTITQPGPLTATISATNNVLCNGDSGNATVRGGGGTSPYTYLWTPTGQRTAMATGLSAGAYNVVITDNNGCTATTAITITQPAVLTATISATNNVLCNGGNGSATVMAGGGTSPYTYLWNPSRQSTATATGLSAGGYTVTVSDNNGCSATVSVTVTQPALLTDRISTINKILCNGGNGNATVTAVGGTLPYTYLWTPSAESTATATGLSIGIYSVEVTDKNHCTASATVNMTQPALLTAAILSDTGISCNNGNNGSATARGGGGVSPYTYLWTPGGNTNAHATGLFAVSYTVTVTDSNGCTATARTTLTQPVQLAVNINEPEIICKNSTGKLYANTSGGTSPYIYDWSTGTTSTGNSISITPISTVYYTVTVTDVNGCSASGDITLKYGPSFAVAITGKGSVCVGDSATICANAIGALDGTTYLWEPENKTNACITITPTQATVYTVIVMDGCGASTTASTNVSIVPSPKVNMYANFYQGCEPLCIQFQNGTTLSQGKISQYIWSFNLASGERDTSFLANPIHCYPYSGSYNVSLTVVSDSGCSATLERVDMITVYSPPKAAFTYSPNPTTIENPTITFTDESRDASDSGSNGGIVYRIWSFGDGSDSTSYASNPSHTYKDTGTYCASLFVMNSGGCTDTATNCLVIDPAFKLYIPSAFTPNGDERNETFQAVGQYVKSFEMYIFDRWGSQIYHSTNINDGWNGKVNGNGSICQEDVYVYKITVMDSKDIQHSYVGNVTLIK